MKTEKQIRGELSKYEWRIKHLKGLREMKVLDKRIIKDINNELFRCLKEARMLEWVLENE